MNGVPELVFTGGPCGMKTTALARIQSWLMDLGYRVFICPEIATMIIKGGMQDVREIAEHRPEQYISLQKRILEMQLIFCEQWRKLAVNFPEKPRAILYDRGPMDGAAYIDRRAFEHIMKSLGATFSNARDNFDAVIHLVTAADGAEQYYTLENNEARSESLQEARELDQRIQAAWSGSNHVVVIGNDPPGAEIKFKRIQAAVARKLGIPVPLEIERKYLLHSVPNIAHIHGVQIIEIEQIYLTSIGSERRRIRKRTASDGSSTYYLTVKTPTADPAIRHETEQMIDEFDYDGLAYLQEPGTRIIRKTRACFIWSRQYFELDIFHNPSGIVYLEIELTEENDKIHLPPFIYVNRDVTEESGSSNYDLAKLT